MAGYFFGRQMKKTHLFIIISTVILLVSGCLKSANDSTTLPIARERMQPVRGGSANIAIAEPVSIDPIDLEEPNGMLIGANLFDSLTETEPRSMKLIPAAASSWESDEHMKIWVFHLRKDGVFHNGRPVKAADFKYAWERIAKRGSASAVAYHLEPIIGFDEMQTGDANELTGVKALNERTLEIHLKYPFADFPTILANATLAPVPKEEVDKDPRAFAENPIGNGPFKMSEAWKHDQSIRLIRFEEYPGNKTYLDSVEFLIFTDERSAYMAFQNGNVDFSIVPVSDVELASEELGKGRYEARDRQRFLCGPELSIYFFGFNVSSPLYSTKPGLRKAINMAIDRKKIVNELFAGTKSPLQTIVPSGVPGHLEEPGIYAIYDVKKAQQILEKSGYPGGKDEDGDPLTITININQESSHEKIAELIQDDLAKIGIKAVISNPEWMTFLEETAHGNAGFFRMGWMADYPLQDNFLMPLFYSENIPDQKNAWSGDNMCRYRNKEVDALLFKARSEKELAKRQGDYAQAEKLVLDDAVVIPLFAVQHRHAVSQRIYGLIYDPLNRIDMSRVWVRVK